MSGIYLHIPFCKQACSYCDFYFVTRTSEREHFVQQLLKEIQDYADTRYSEETVKTIYFGGGTPSLLEPRQVEKILEALEQTFEVDSREITFEMNPDDVTEPFLADLRSLGVNRASMGVQSFDPELLEFMHRAHSSEEALHCLELLSKSRFESYTVDLIYGNPNQSNEQLEADLDKLLPFNPPHISAYSLTIEPNTRLGKQVELGRIAPPEDDKVAAHFEIVNERLSEQGIERYEVSNYSRAGCEADHNSSYWEHENYLGLGPGAHSFWWDEKAYRWENETDLRSYLRNEDSKDKEQLSLEQLAEERLMMGLRTRLGVGFEELEQKYDYTLTDRQQQYLTNRQQEEKLKVDDRIKLTGKGIKIADAIILDLVTLH
ncbi:oxygen-independent coproporphyrinogen-3 oxidase [Fodinibius salinus]|uniref:Heme chaperone HemW n=1 Tax=Fodinibius salinus TaxID=860790 RepID=A0A5D3YKF6_9BACT|nr:radical SAM family heme chaperone HemW [Fodinibius salinus]TYP93910.1 oxygen-independent coproporphyrinogen-3 oxidase [Fodinibius salinus]